MKDRPLIAPDGIPQELWDAHRETMLPSDPERKKIPFHIRWQEYTRLHKSYVQNENYTFLKNNEGDWLRKEATS